MCIARFMGGHQYKPDKTFDHSRTVMRAIDCKDMEWVSTLQLIYLFEKESRELLTPLFKKPFSNHVAVSHYSGFVGLSSSYLLQPDHDTRGWGHSCMPSLWTGVSVCVLVRFSFEMSGIPALHGMISLCQLHAKARSKCCQSISPMPFFSVWCWAVYHGSQPANSVLSGPRETNSQQGRLVLFVFGQDLLAIVLHRVMQDIQVVNVSRCL